MTTTTKNVSYLELGDSKYRELDRATGRETLRTEKRMAMGVDQSRTSTSTPNYRKLVRSQKLPSNAYSYTRNTTWPPSGFTTDNTGGILASGPFKGYERYENTRIGLVDAPIGIPNVTGPSSAELAAMDRKCIHDLLMKIKDQKINLAQAAAERAQTAKTVGDAAIRLANALRALKKGKFGDAASALGLVGRVIRRQDNRNYFNQQRSMARGWLELQYGWRPLLADVYGAAEALAKAYHLPPVEKVVKTRWVDTNRASSGQDFNIQKTYTYEDYEQSRTYIRYVCSFTNGNAITKSLSELGITNPALIAWELMPWSFVIDWFIPIGDFISSWDATLGLQFQQGTKTVFRKGLTTRAIKYGPATGFGGTRTGYAVCSRELISIERTKLFSFPSPQLPAFKNPLSLEHLANAMALLRQLKR